MGSSWKVWLDCGCCSWFGVERESSIVGEIEKDARPNSQSGERELWGKRRGGCSSAGRREEGNGGGWKKKKKRAAMKKGTLNGRGRSGGKARLSPPTWGGGPRPSLSLHPSGLTEGRKGGRRLGEAE